MHKALSLHKDICTKYEFCEEVYSKLKGTPKFTGYLWIFRVMSYSFSISFLFHYLFLY